MVHYISWNFWVGFTALPTRVLWEGAFISKVKPESETSKLLPKRFLLASLTNEPEREVKTAAKLVSGSNMWVVFALWTNKDLQPHKSKLNPLVFTIVYRRWSNRIVELPGPLIKERTINIIKKEQLLWLSTLITYLFVSSCFNHPLLWFACLTPNKNNNKY